MRSDWVSLVLDLTPLPAMLRTSEPPNQHGQGGW